MCNGHERKPAFTLVELLVVIGVIALLIALLVPAFGAVRTVARTAETQSIFTSITAGLETYRNEFDGPYPPSRSDDPDPDNINLTVNPYFKDDIRVTVTGANLLVWAMAGADLLGTPGFEDTDGDGLWSDNISKQGGDDGGGPGWGGTFDPHLYALNDTADGGLEEAYSRKGPYVDINKTKIASMREYALDSLQPRNNPDVSIPAAGEDPQRHYRQKFFLDGFGFPILYYKANVSAGLIVSDYESDPPKIGVYTQEDNRLYTGSGDFDNPTAGMDLGAGPFHDLLLTQDEISPDPDLTNPNDYARSFAKFIWDRQKQARNEPVNKDSYILLSPGKDALWGTDDDIKNFSE